MRMRRRIWAVVAAVLGLLATTMAPAGAILDLRPSDNRSVEIQDHLVPDFLVRLDTSDGGRCSGSLADSEFVVTAAHCVVVSGGFDSVCGVNGTARVRQARDFTATIGGQEIRRGVKEIAVHPGYTLDNPRSNDDIAVLWLDRAVPTDYTTLKVEPLPSRSATYGLRSFGYGHHEPDTCNARLDNEPRAVSHNSLPLNEAGHNNNCVGNLCTEAGWRGGAVVCRGDSGGPTVRDGRTLVAVIQATVGSNDGCGFSFRETIHTYAGRHENFIKSAIAVRVCPSQLSQNGANVRMVSWGEGSTGRADVVIGTNRGETLSGFGGNDVICGRGGADTIFGHEGADLSLIHI